MKNLRQIENNIKWSEFYSDHFNWKNNIPFYKTFQFDFEFLNEFKKEINWYDLILLSPTVTEEMVDKFNPYINLNRFIRYHKNISETFIEKYLEQLDLSILLEFQNLSEEFLIKYHKKFNRLCWVKISKHQNLTEQFVNRFQDQLNLELFFMTNFSRYKLSKQFLKKLYKKYESKSLLKKFIEPLLYS